MRDPYDWRTDAEIEEDIRAAAVCGEAVDAKTHRAATWADHADHLNKAAKENPDDRD